MSVPHLLCVGLTPTVQRTMRFPELQVGEVNRARDVVTTASGKAVNVARVLATLGAEVRLVQPLSGDAGRFVHTHLPFAQDVVWGPESAPTRTCTTLLTDSGVTTELVEEAPPLPDPDREALVACIEAALPGAGALALSGSLPPGVPSSFYAHVLGRAQHHGVPVFLDAQKEPLRLALAGRPYLAKPNRSETIAALGLPEHSDALTCARALREAGAHNALVSDGRAGAVLLTDDGAWTFFPPRVVALNPIGAGDSLLAGVVYQGWQRTDLRAAVHFGIACAAANCLTLTSGVVEPDTVARLHPQVRSERVQ